VSRGSGPRLSMQCIVSQFQNQWVAHLGRGCVLDAVLRGHHGQPTCHKISVRTSEFLRSHIYMQLLIMNALQQAYLVAKM